MLLGSMPLRSTAARMATAPNRGAVKGESAPRNFPIGVLAAPTTTTSERSATNALHE
jgi:hypothetical protein